MLQLSHLLYRQMPVPRDASSALWLFRAKVLIQHQNPQNKLSSPVKFIKMLASRVQPLVRAGPRSRGLAVRAMAVAKVGDALPSATVWENNPGESSKLTDLFKVCHDHQSLVLVPAIVQLGLSETTFRC